MECSLIFFKKSLLGVTDFSLQIPWNYFTEYCIYFSNFINNITKQIQTERKFSSKLQNSGRHNSNSGQIGYKYLH